VAEESETVGVTMVRIHGTSGAILVTQDEDSDPIWLARSQVTNVKEAGQTKAGVQFGPDTRNTSPPGGYTILEFTIPVWLATREGLI
jgi:hypothetical protein